MPGADSKNMVECFVRFNFENTSYSKVIYYPPRMVLTAEEVGMIFGGESLQ